MDIDISKIDKATLLAALYNNSKPLGMGILHFDPKPMTKEEAEEILKEGFDFDYLKGRVMKVNLDGDMMRVDLYDRDNGEGAAEKVISKLREA